MNKKKEEKRVIKGYKIRPSIYKKAMKRANKSGNPLATSIEVWVEMYSKGMMINFMSPAIVPKGVPCSSTSVNSDQLKDVIVSM